MLSRLRRRLAAEHGISLIEVLIAIVIAGVVGGAIVNAMSQGTRAAQRSHNRVTALAELQTVAQRVARELRAANPITLADATQAEVAVNRAGQSRTYRFRLVADGTTYRIEEVRTIAGVGSTSILARGLPVTGLALRYYDGTGTELLPPVTGGNVPLIRTIKVTLSRFIPLNTAPITLETTVDVRNQA